MTWLDTEDTTWRVELVAGRWPLSRYVPASETWPRVGSYPSRKQQSAPPTEKPSASTGIGTQRRPAPAIRAGPLRCRTGTAAQTAAAQVGKRCQLSNRTRHGCIIAHTYDNAPGVAWPTLTSRSPTLTPGRAGQATPVTTLTRLRPSPGPSWATSSRRFCQSARPLWFASLPAHTHTGAPIITGP